MPKPEKKFEPYPFFKSTMVTHEKLTIEGTNVQPRFSYAQVGYNGYANYNRGLIKCTLVTPSCLAILWKINFRVEHFWASDTVFSLSYLTLYNFGSKNGQTTSLIEKDSIMDVKNLIMSPCGKYCATAHDFMSYYMIWDLSKGMKPIYTIETNIYNSNPRFSSDGCFYYTHTLSESQKERREVNLKALSTVPTMIYEKDPEAPQLARRSN